MSFITGNKQIISKIFIIGLINFALFDPILAQTDTGDIARGAQGWVNNCSRCHNLRPANEYNAQEWQTILMHMRLQAGLTGQQVQDIYAFLAPQPVAENTSETDPSNTTSQNGHKNITVASLSGKEIFEKTCQACHGADGKGVIPGAPDFSSKNSPLKNLSKEVLLKHIENGFQSPGSPAAMPPRGGNPNLTDQELSEVLEYMEKTFNK